MSNEHAELVDGLRRTFMQGKPRSYEWRIGQLRKIKKMITECASKYAAALSEDLGKCNVEAYAIEINTIHADLDYAMANLKTWMQPVNVGTPGLWAPCRTKVVHEPYGVCLIVSPFNYPILLAIVPLFAAVMAGNCALIKPSELSPRCAEILASTISTYLDNDCIKVVQGGVSTMKSLLSLRYDKILFTGSSRVGRIILEAAAKHITPVTLELGGKCPVIVDKTCVDLDVAARRIIWGKVSNMGQTCIAPDFVLCHKDVHDVFVEKCVTAIKQFYGSDPKTCPDLGHIVSEGHCQRIQSLLDDRPGKIVIGGGVDVSTRFVEPTIITDVRLDSRIMEEEIFAPILPIIAVDNFDEAINILRNKERPLAMYIFTNDQKLIKKAEVSLPSGAMVVNDIMVHMNCHELPLGGVGNSGLGCYRGK
eukprot:gene1321-2543_t